MTQTTDGRGRLAPPPSMQDVADHAGVAIGTVSNVLNHPHRVRAATREKVEAAIASLGFVRNSAARDLAAGSSRLVGMVLVDIGNSFFVDIARGVETATDQAGLQLLLANSDVNLGRQDELLTLFDEARAAGMILAPLDGPLNAARVVQSHGRPIVLVNVPVPTSDLCNVSIDDAIGGGIAAQHLIEQGCQHLAFIGGPLRLHAVNNRLTGATEVAKQSGVRLTVVETESLVSRHGRQAATTLLGKRQRVDGIICSSDTLAIGVIRAAVDLGLTVPDDVAVIGYDDNHFAADSVVPVSTIGQSGHQMGELAMQLLLAEMADIHHEHRSVQVKPHLIARRSSLRQPG